MTDNIAKLLYKILKLYNVSITKRAIQQTILTHPDYPSILCISDALDGWKVKHVVMRLTIEKLQDLDIPVIAQMKKGNYVWVTRITDSKVYLETFSSKGKIINRDLYEKEFSGAVLAINDVTGAGEPDFKEKHIEEVKEKLFRYAIIGSFVVLLTLLAYFSWINDSKLSLLAKILLLFINAAGCYISYTLIRQEKHQSNNRLAKKFCVAGSHIDCNQVTKSHYSKLLGLISWAEVGMVYFSAVMLWLVLAPVSSDWLNPLKWLLLVPLPFTIWSLFTQAFLIRKWCLFCCAIIFFLWINAGMLVYFMPFVSFCLPVVESALLALLILACTVTVMYVCKTDDSRNPYSAQRETARITYNYQTLQSQLSESKYEINNVGFVWGNTQNLPEITLYVSIACSHCGSAVKELRRLTDIYPDFCFRLIFSVKTEDVNHKSNIIVIHLTSLYKKMNKNEFFDALDAWYSMLNKNLEELQKAFPVQDMPNCKADIDALYHFGQRLKISYTPAILINGRLLSSLYSYHDLYGIARTLYAEEQSLMISG